MSVKVLLLFVGNQIFLTWLLSRVSAELILTFQKTVSLVFHNYVPYIYPDAVILINADYEAENIPKFISSYVVTIPNLAVTSFI